MKIENPLFKRKSDIDKNHINIDLTRKKENLIMDRVRDLVPKKLSFLERTKNHNE